LRKTEYGRRQSRETLGGGGKAVVAESVKVKRGENNRGDPRKNIDQAVNF